MRHSILIASLVCMTLTAACATRRPTLPAAPRVEMPADAARPCSIFILPEAPSESDLEIGFTTRGAQIVACNAARSLAVQTHEAEHALEDRFSPKSSKQNRPRSP